jgi:hypothetical protein
MSDEFCVGVKILLKRMESHPEEFQKGGTYAQLTMAVFARKGKDTEGYAFLIRGLTDAEVDALHAGIIKLSRSEFDEWVMKEVLVEAEEKKHWAVGAMAQIKPESVMSKLKRELGL